MDERQIGLALALQELGLSRDVDGFDSRLILQKAVYLIEEAGIRLGYPYNWYLRGPYSPALTRDLFDLASNKQDIDGWVLDGQSQTIAQRIKPLLEDRTGEDRQAKASRLELLASLRFLSRRKQINIESSDEATNQLARNGKNYSSDQVAAAIEDLRQFGLL